MATGAQRSRAYRDRKLAAGYRLIHGRLTREPLKNRPRLVPPPHGTSARYTWPHDPCRCDECKQERSEYVRELRARRRAGIA